MRRTLLLSFAVAAFVPLLACDLRKKKDDADAAAEAGVVAPATATAAPTDTGAATATATGAATLGTAKPGTTPTGVVPKVDGGPAADAGVAAVDAGPVKDGGAIPAPTLTIPQFDGGIPGFDAGAFKPPPGFDAGAFKPPWVK